MKSRTGLNLYKLTPAVGFPSERRNMARPSPPALCSDGRILYIWMKVDWQASVRYIASGFLRLTTCVLVHAREQFTRNWLNCCWPRTLSLKPEWQGVRRYAPCSEIHSLWTCNLCIRLAIWGSTNRSTIPDSVRMSSPGYCYPSEMSGSMLLMFPPSTWTTN